MSSDLVNLKFKNINIWYQDKLEQIIRKKQTAKPVTKLPLENPEKYPALWFDNQEDLVI